MKRLLLPLLAALALSNAVNAGYSSKVDLMTDETKIKVYHQSETKVPNSIGIQESATIEINEPKEKAREIKKITGKYKLHNFIASENIQKKDSLVFTCLNCVKPKYPRIALNTKREGKMIFKLYVQKNG